MVSIHFADLAIVFCFALQHAVYAGFSQLTSV